MSDSDLRIGPRRFSAGRLKFFKVIERILVALGGRSFYRRRFLQPGRFRVRQEELLRPDLPAELEGFCVVQFSDIHAGTFLGPGDLKHVVAAANSEQADLVVFTGDLLCHRSEEAYLPLGDLAQVQARLGRLAVFGNHDYKGRREGEIAARYAAEAGWRFLRNEGQRYQWPSGAAIHVTGLEDLEESKGVDLRAARQGLRPDDLEICLVHNPQGAEAVAGGQCCLVLSGHSHGGQIALPLIRRLAPPHPGDRRELRGSVLVVSHGLGVLGCPLRVRAVPELVVVRLRRAPSVGGDKAASADRSIQPGARA
jgi:uncharacterized protein